MNRPIPLQALRARAEETAAFSRRRRRATTTIAGIAILGASMSACGSGGSDADAATDPVSTVAADGTDVTASPSETGAPSGRPTGMGGTGGEVTAIDGTTMTVESQGRDGTTTTLTVETSDDTVVTTTAAGVITDLTVGDQVVAIGETVDDQFVATMITEGGGGIVGAGFPGGTPGERPEFPDGRTPDGSLPTPPADGSFPTPPEGFPEGFPDRAPTGEGGAGPGGQGRGPAGGGFLAGTITDVGDSTITIESDDGTETVVRTGDDISVTVAVDMELSDIELGSTVRVSGDDTGGVVAATSIVIVSD